MTTVVATYAPAGEGHRRASEAIAEAARPEGQVTVHLRDGLEGSQPWFRWTYTMGYLTLVRAAPILWGGLYQLTDRWGSARWMQCVRRRGNARQDRGFAEWLVATQPDAILCTHFFPVEVATALRRTGRLQSRIISVITDWLPHAFWICPGVDHYAVASEATRAAMLCRGIPANRVTVTGIPIDQRFANALDRREAAGRLGLDPTTFTILIASGGFGVGPIEALIRALGQLTTPCQLLVVAGRNEGLRRSLEALRLALRHRMTVYGFVNNMDELMSAADLLISKSGGLTCAEAMAKGLPMVIVAPIPGQEARNSRVLVAAGAAMPLRRVAEIVPLVERLRQPGALAAMTAAARRLGQPQAARDVLQLAMASAHD